MVFDKIEEEISSWDLPEFIENVLFGLIAFFFSSMIHEAGHVIFAIIFGCPAAIKHVGMITGLTGIGECSNFSLQWIALGGGITSFLFGLYVWFGEKKTKLRILSLYLFLFSSVLQLVPYKPLDGYWAVYYGMPIYLELFIWFTIFSISINLIMKKLNQ